MASYVNCLIIKIYVFITTDIRVMVILWRKILKNDGGYFQDLK
jgi:hypothetical protein